MLVGSDLSFESYTKIQYWPTFVNDNKIQLALSQGLSICKVIITHH